MKKFILILGMLTCMLGLSACANTVVEEEPFMSEAEAVTNAESIVGLIQQVYASGSVADFTMQYGEAYPAVIDAFTGWESAQEDLGDYAGVVGSEVSYKDDQVIVNVTIDGSVHDAIVEVIMDKTNYVSISTNIQYSFAELMEKAALNTILGMGVVFAVLILISVIIYCMGFIPKIQEKMTKKNSVEEPKKETQAVDNTIAQIVEKEELSDDLELVAVIAAAIAASEGATSTDGFVVRSIRRRY